MVKKVPEPTNPPVERAFLVGIELRGSENILSLTESMSELALLAETAGLDVVGQATQKMTTPNVQTYIGSGKVEEIKVLISEFKADVIVFDVELSPRHLRELESLFGDEVRILDRTALILDIFAQHAHTNEGVLQVELAQYEYRLPRLTRAWTHLSKQYGGIGTKGPGETQIETDRRIIRDKISTLKEQLKKIDVQMSTQRRNRGKMVRVSLVGYTNVGKSTIMNLLSKSDVFAENKLFATLDTTVRKVVIGNLPFLLSDTVGFIRKLPHDLIKSFKSTLDEVRESDLLIHVVDISHPGFEDHNNTVMVIILNVNHL